MVSVTTVFLFKEEARALWATGVHGLTLDRVFGWVMSGSLCWYVTRGGKFASGCFSLSYGLIFLVFALVGIGAVFGGHPTGTVGRVVLDSGKDWNSNLKFFLVGGWTAFSLWVLLVSKDARLYMTARRQGIAESEANAFRWPPDGRRQG